ncbi:MAG: DnaA N-terminal domain-containing protein, partial [Alkalispirochaetaceae bacterium]
MDNWDYGVFWEETIKQIRQEVSEQEYSMWFNQIQYSRS